MSDPIVLVEKRGPVAVVTLNRPAAMNALSTELRLSLIRIFRELQDDATIRSIVLTGAGRAFCAGMDLKELSAGGPDVTGLDNCSDGLELDAAISGFKGPVIAAINGFAIAGGLELALSCDMMLAASSATFADTHARVGMLPGWGLSQKLPRLIGVARAKEISFSGNAITAGQAYDWGLINRVVDDADLLDACVRLAGQMADCAGDALFAYKQLIDHGLDLPLTEAMVYERRVAQEFGRNVSSTSIASRKEGLLARGREQADSTR